MKKTILFLFLSISIYINVYSQVLTNKAKLENVNFTQQGEYINVQYSLTNSNTTDKFYVFIEAFSSSGVRQTVTNIEGDFGMLESVGTKNIKWRVGKDLPNFDGKLSIKVSAKIIPYAPTSDNLKNNLILPGSGLSPKKVSLGVKAYSFLGIALITNIVTNSFYNKYGNTITPSSANITFGTAKTFKILSNISLLSAVYIWSSTSAKVLLNSSKYQNITPQKIEEDDKLELISSSSTFNSVYTKYEREAMPPNLYAELSFTDENGNGILEALETSTLQIKLINKGKGKAQGLGISITDAVTDENLIIGAVPQEKNIEADGVSLITIPISALQEIQTAQHKFKISVTEYFGYDMDDAYLLLNTYQYQIPKIAFAGIEISDSGDNTMAINADGKLQAGEQVGVKVILQNTEQGLARDVKYSVRTTNTDVYIKNVTGNLGQVTGGSLAEFTFILSPNKKVTGTSVLPIFLTVSEKINGTQMEEFQLPIYLNAKPKAPEIVKVESNFASLEKNIAKFEYTSDKFTSNIGNIVDISIVPETAVKRKNSVGVVFGIENYKNLAPAPYADNDANIIEEYFKKTLGLEQVVTYTNEEVSGFIFDDVFNSETGELQKAIVKGETDLFVYYSGHGVPDKEGKNVYLFPSDGKYKNLETQGYNINLLYENLEKLGAKSVTVFIDACFSGASRTSETMVAQNVTGEKAGVKIRLNTTKPWESDSTFAVFNSSSFDETSLGFDESQTGLFTYYLCAGMQGAADTDANKNITLGELKNYVISNVSATSKKISGQQTPQFNGNENLILIEY